MGVLSEIIEDIFDKLMFLLIENKIEENEGALVESYSSTLIFSLTSNNQPQI